MLLLFFITFFSVFGWFNVQPLYIFVSSFRFCGPFKFQSSPLRYCWFLFRSTFVMMPLLLFNTCSHAHTHTQRWMRWNQFVVHKFYVHTTTKNGMLHVMRALKIRAYPFCDIKIHFVGNTPAGNVADECGSQLLQMLYTIHFFFIPRIETNPVSQCTHTHRVYSSECLLIQPKQMYKRTNGMRACVCSHRLENQWRTIYARMGYTPHSFNSNKYSWQILIKTEIPKYRKSSNFSALLIPKRV